MTEATGSEPESGSGSGFVSGSGSETESGSGSATGSDISSGAESGSKAASESGSNTPTDDESKAVPEAVTPVVFSVHHAIILKGIDAQTFNADNAIVTAFRKTVASLLSAPVSSILNIIAKDKGNQRRHRSRRNLVSPSCT